MSLPIIPQVRSYIREFQAWDWRGLDRQTQLYYLTLALIAVIAVYLRFRRLGEASLWIDEAFSSWAGWNFLMGNGFSDPIGPSSPYRRAWLTTSLPIAASFELFGRTEFAARLPSVIYSLGTIVVAYLIAIRYDRLLGVLTAGFLAVDPFVLTWGRIARMYAPLGFFFLASIYIILRWYDDDFRFKSPYPFVLGVVVFLGQNAHQAYLTLGVSTVLFLTVVLIGRIRGLETIAIDEIDSLSRRLVVLIVGGILVAGLYFIFIGVPGVVTASPPGTWPDRDPLYYWTLFGQAYPILRFLSLGGMIYLCVRRPDARLLVLAFVVAFAVASVTPRKAPRYVYYIAPLLAIPGLYAIAAPSTVLWQKIMDEDGRLGLFWKSTMYLIPIFVLFIVASPAAGVTVTESVNDNPYRPTVSDWKKASAYVTEHADEDDVVVSTRPELSMWYYGKTDYFFRQNGLDPVDKQNGMYVHPRTGAIYLNNTNNVEQLLGEKRDIWLFAGKKYELSFTGSEERMLVREEFEQKNIISAENINVYYRPAAQTDQ